jgi:hypothetical protein
MSSGLAFLNIVRTERFDEVISREFSSIPVTGRLYPNRAEESRRAVCPEKWPEAQAERVAGVHVFSS